MGFQDQENLRYFTKMEGSIRRYLILADKSMEESQKCRRNIQILQRYAIENGLKIRYTIVYARKDLLGEEFYLKVEKRVKEKGYVECGFASFPANMDVISTISKDI